MAMEKECLEAFMNKAVEDPVIGPLHISLYAALVRAFQQQNRNPISVYRRELVQWAKISHRAYHKCMQDLAAGGYIEYLPSFNPFLGSLVTLKKEML